MKHFMLPRNAILREADPAPPSSSSPNPNHSKSKMRRQKSSKENAPPPDSNSHPFPPAAAKMKSPLPPRPPSSNPLKRKLSIDALAENVAVGASDSGVKVIVRMRPLLKEEEEAELIVQKVSSGSLNINGQVFTFDYVADVDAKQQDIFQLVGAPLVENCLGGFNSSVFAYGQTGSGKTFTMWGPANALMDENVSSDQQGLTPRVFERLFARINEEQVKHADKQLKYQCRCSFLEIYNEQITDLLDPNQRNLQIREDVKSGVYVENLTEEYVCLMKDVTHLLIKGLSNRRTGATSINAESSRSHSVFTCVVESRCKSISDGISSFKTSRINLVDLAGSERQKLTGAAGERLKEAGNINRSLSQLGNLINILSEVSTNNKARHIPYRDSKLTFLLQESLGGNAKLAMVCAISPAQRCKSETFSTLRFAQRAKAIKNKAVVNEVMQDDVNVLREVIRQLKDELQRMKTNGQKPADLIGGYSTGWNARRSLNLLKFSLNHPRTLSHVDEDGDEEMEIDEEAVERLCVQVGLLSETNQCQSAHQLDSIFIKEQESEDTDVKMEEELSEQAKNSEILTVDSENSVAANGIDISSGHMPIRDNEDVNMEGEFSEQAKNCVITTVDCENSVAANATGISAGHLPIRDNEDVDDVFHQIVEKNDGDSSEQPSAKELISCPSIEHKREGSPAKDMLHDLSSSALDPPSTVSECVPVAGVQSDGQEGPGNCVSPNISVVTSDVSPLLKSLTPSVSPKLNQSRKSLRTSSMLTASQKDLKNDISLGPVAMHESFAHSPKCASFTALSTHGRHSTVSTKCLASTVSTKCLAASLQRGLEIIDSHRQSSALRRSLFMFSLKPTEPKTTLPIHKVNVGVQTFPQEDSIEAEEAVACLCSTCKKRKHEETEEDHDRSNMQLVPIDGTDSAEKSKKQVPKAVEKILAGSIRREMALEEFCARQASEINQLSRLVQQYKHERECNAIIAQTREDKILRLESLMDGVLPSEEFLEEDLFSLRHEYNLLKDKYENHPGVLRTKIELKRVQDELESYRNFHDFGEREVLLEEVQDLRNQLQNYIDSSSTTSKRHNSVMQLTDSCEPKFTAPLSVIPETIGESQLEQERIRWTEAESKWISLTEELRSELEASRLLAEKRKQELNTERKCAEELKEAMQMAMEGHARMLEQYADLEERHILLLSRHRNIQEGINDVKKAAARAGVRGAESKFINALAAEISALRVEREKERRHLRDENKGLQAQLKDTAEAVQAAGELLVRLKEAEEAVAAAQKRAMDAEQEAVKAYKQIDKLKRKYEREISSLNELIAESRLPKEAIRPTCNNDFDAGECHDASDQQWREEFAPFYNGEDSDLSKLADQEWFTGYDRCNI